MVESVPMFTKTKVHRNSAVARFCSSCAPSLITDHVMRVDSRDAANNAKAMNLEDFSFAPSRLRVKRTELSARHAQRRLHGLLDASRCLGNIVRQHIGGRRNNSMLFVDHNLAH